MTRYMSDPTQRQNLPAFLQVGPNGSGGPSRNTGREPDRAGRVPRFQDPAGARKGDDAQADPEVYTRIIMGESIDEFDKMVKDWYALGGEQITAEVNDWYKKNR